MPRPTIIYNASSGSDTAASGSNAPTTAVTGIDADGTAAGTTVTLNETVDFTGVVDDSGSDAIWVNTDGGDRHLFSINTFTGGVSTCTAIETHDTIDSTFAGVIWAVGGLRQTLENDDSDGEDWRDAGSGWTYEFQAGEYIITAAIAHQGGGDATDGPVTFRSSDTTRPGGVEPVIVNNNSQFAFQVALGGHIVIDGFLIRRDSSFSSGSGGLSVSGSAEIIEFRRIRMDGANMGYGVNWGSNGKGVCEDCETFDVARSGGPAGNSGFRFAGGRPGPAVLRCSAHDCIGDGFIIDMVQSLQNFSLIGCKSYDNGVHGFDIVSLATATNSVLIKDCLADRNDSDGLNLDDTPAASSAIVIEGCVFTENGGFGVSATAALADNNVAGNRNNHYDGNTSGARDNLAVGAGDTSGDPRYTNTTDGSEDYTPLPDSPLWRAGAEQAVS